MPVTTLPAHWSISVIIFDYFKPLSGLKQLPFMLKSTSQINISSSSPNITCIAVIPRGCQLKDESEAHITKSLFQSSYSPMWKEFFPEVQDRQNSVLSQWQLFIHQELQFKNRVDHTFTGLKTGTVLFGRGNSFLGGTRSLNLALDEAKLGDFKFVTFLYLERTILGILL